MVPYSDRWRLHRRLFHQAFRSEASLNYHPIQLQKARDLIHSLLETPESYVGHIQTCVGSHCHVDIPIDFFFLSPYRHSASIIMSVVYGYEVVHQDDPILNVVDKAVNFAVSCIRPEIAAILGFFPFRKCFMHFFLTRLSSAPSSAIHSNLGPGCIPQTIRAAL